MIEKWIYALYKGEDLLSMGTIQEIAEEMKVKTETLFYYATPSYKKEHQRMPEDSYVYHKKRRMNMQTLELVQWGGKRSVVKITYTDTQEIEYLIVNNDYLMKLDDLGLIV